MSKRVLQENKACQIFRKTYISYSLIRTHAKPTKWSNTLKQFVDNSRQIISNCLSVFENFVELTHVHIRG